MTNHMKFTATNGHAYLTRIVFKGDRYGRDGCLTHDKDDPVVEFYTLTEGDKDGSLSWDGVKGCWFISRYYLSTFLGKSEYSRNGGPVKNGVCLDGAYPQFSLDAQDCQKVAAWIESLDQGEGSDPA